MRDLTHIYKNLTDLCKKISRSFFYQNQFSPKNQKKERETFED